jgi:hypothetical protein
MTKPQANAPTPNEATTPQDAGPRQDFVTTLRAEMEELRALLSALTASTESVADRLAQVEQRLGTLEQRAPRP